MTETARIIISSIVALTWLLLTLWCLRHWLWRSRPAASDGRDLIAYASQGGRSFALAEHLHTLLSDHHNPLLLSLNDVGQEQLLTARRLFFIASTYGEGEAPDNGANFYKHYLNKPTTIQLNGTAFAVLALGDKRYSQFCGFGQQLQQALLNWGGNPLREIQTLEPAQMRDHDKVLRQWLAGLPDINLPPPAYHQDTDPAEELFNHWQLHERFIVNPNSPGAPLFHITAKPIGLMPHWQPGDTLEIQPCNSKQRIEQWLHQTGLNGDDWLTQPHGSQSLFNWLAERHLPMDATNGQHTARQWLKELPCLPLREYSIASIPKEQGIRLLVRQEHKGNGEYGLGSGWLTLHATSKNHLRGRIRNNPNFHPPSISAPLILIGAGSGLAGLRAHIAWRARRTHQGLCWLCYGERSPEHDQIWQDELQHWCNSGVLSKLTLAYSRDNDHPCYVQDAIHQQADTVQQWVDQGAYLYICGRLTGMGEAVEETLLTVLGSEQLQALKDEGRYCRDLY